MDTVLMIVTWVALLLLMVALRSAMRRITRLHALLNEAHVQTEGLLKTLEEQTVTLNQTNATLTKQSAMLNQTTANLDRSNDIAHKLLAERRAAWGISKPAGR
jgi:septal ring factor EnvC (AmiA/AmiB activator)